MKVLGIGETVIDKTIVVKRHGNMSRFAHVQEDTDVERYFTQPQKEAAMY